jgi:hypothetical protein
MMYTRLGPIFPGNIDPTSRRLTGKLLTGMTVLSRLLPFVLVVLGLTSNTFGRGGTVRLTPADSRFVDVWLYQRPNSADVHVLLLVQIAASGDNMKWVELRIDDQPSQMRFYLAPAPEKPASFPTVNSQAKLDALRSLTTDAYTFVVPRRLLDKSELFLSASRPSAPNSLTFRVRLKDWAR